MFALVPNRCEELEQRCDCCLSGGRASVLWLPVPNIRIPKLKCVRICWFGDISCPRGERKNLGEVPSQVVPGSVQRGIGYHNTVVCFHKAAPQSFWASDCCEETVTSGFQRSHRFAAASVVNVRKVSCHKLFRGIQQGWKGVGPGRKPLSVL